MPELPEVETVARELNRKLKDKTIKSVEVFHGKIVALGPGTVPPKRDSKAHQVKKFIALLTGQKIRSVARRAKLLIFSAKGGSASGGNFYRRGSPSPQPSPARGEGGIKMLVHLKMTGQFIYFKKSELAKQVRIINKQSAPLHSMPAKYTHVIFTFTNGSKLFYNDVRQFGYLKLVSDFELPRVKDLNEFGPEPLDKAFTLKVFSQILLKRPNAKIKQLLTEPRLIAGIGNIYSDEILFRAKVGPARKASTLKPPEIRAIYRAIPFILKKGIATHGSSVGDFIRTDGSWGSMGKYHFVYGRAGLHCKVCGTTITSAKFGGRTGSYCPTCQK